MRLLLFFLLCYLLSAVGTTLQAQRAANVGFADFLSNMPKSLPTLKETMAAYGDAGQMTDAIKRAGKEIEENLRLVYEPLLPVVKKRAGEMEHLPPNDSGKEDQFVLKAFQVASKSVLEHDGMNTLMHVMEHYHLLYSVSRLSWTKLNPSASAPVHQLFKQVKEMEAQFDWAGFAKQAAAYAPKFGSDDEKSKALTARFEEEFKKLPKKKVQEQGITLDMEDPDGAIALLEKFRVDLDLASEQFYHTRYQWRDLQCRKLSAMSRRLDSITAQANSLVRNDADRSIKGAIADLQARLWEAWHKLNSVTHDYFLGAIVNASATLQVQQSLEVYRSYKQK